MFVSALVNDTVGTLAKGRYDNKDVAIAVRKQMSMVMNLD